MKAVDPSRRRAAIRQRGFFVAEGVLSASEVDALKVAMRRVEEESGSEASAAVRKKRGVYAVRHLLALSEEIRALAVDSRVRQLVVPSLGEGAFAVRATFFDKVPGANWVLGMHQDSVISVRQPVDHPDFRSWSKKAGVWQVQPPAGILAAMLAVRIHLDDCGTKNGALRVIPGSHRQGWVDDEVDAWRQRAGEVVCEVEAGGVLVLSPLLLHASSPAEAPVHRRVIHLEFTASELPGGLEWSHRVPADKAPTVSP